MGDRGNIFVKDTTYEKSTGVYLYSHWGGSELKETLQTALKKFPDRWTDESYLTRIVFSTMVKDDVDGETGFGISTYLTDNEHDIIMLDPGTQTVTIGEKKWTFKEFCEEKFK